MDRQTVIIIALLICVVVILFIISYHKQPYITSITNAIKVVENFNTQLMPSIEFKTNCGSTLSLINGKVPFPNSDDYHTIMVSNIPAEIYNAVSITVLFFAVDSTSPKSYTGAELNKIKSAPNTLLLKQTLLENTIYTLKISNGISEIRFTFTTDYNTFTYNVPSASQTINSSTASNYLVMGIKLPAQTTYTYQLDITDQNILNPSDGNYTYNLQIPNFNTYISAAISALQTSTSQNMCIDSEYAELSKYIPFKFDALLTVDRIKDAYPLETVIVPSIKCITTNNCMVTIRNLRKNTIYTIKLRLIYFKVGSINNYRSSPMVSWTFNSGESSDNFFESLSQINNLLTTVKNSYINMDNFNKEQTAQNNRLTAINMEINNSIRPYFN
jgi:hypothetical protein